VSPRGGNALAQRVPISIRRLVYRVLNGARWTRGGGGRALPSRVLGAPHLASATVGLQLHPVRPLLRVLDMDDRGPRRSSSVSLAVSLATSMFALSPHPVRADEPADHCDLAPAASAGGSPRCLPPLAPPAPDIPPIVGITPGVFRLHIKSPRLVVVEHRWGRFSYPICTSPCDAVLDVRKYRRLFVDGKGIARSAAFDLGAATGDVTLDVFPKPVVYQYVGLPLFVSGFVSLPLGALLTVSAGTDHGIDVTGLSLLGFGVAALTAGALLSFCTDTNVQIQASRAAARKPRYWAGEF
jgi:hypothetical protein